MIEEWLLSSKSVRLNSKKRRRKKGYIAKKEIKRFHSKKEKKKGYIAFQLGVIPVHVIALALTLPGLEWAKEVKEIFFRNLCFERRNFLTGLEAFFKSSDTGVELRKRGVNHSVLGIHSKV